MILKNEYLVQDKKVVQKHMIEQWLVDCSDVSIHMVEMDAVRSWAFHNSNYGSFDHVSGRKFLEDIHFQRHLQKLIEKSQNDQGNKIKKTVSFDRQLSYSHQWKEILFLLPNWAKVPSH